MNNNDTILGTIDPEITERLVSRRDALKQGTLAGSKLAAGLALGSIPVALAALSRQAFAQLPANIKAVLDFALVLEILENEFYKAVLGTSSVTANNTAFAPVRATLTSQFPGVVTAVQQIQKHEAAHVAFLTAAGASTTITVNDLDFTGGRGSGTGPFAQATTDAAFLLAVAQLAEDTGVRAYKGQAANLIDNPTVLTQALRIHSVEARHASKIRRTRRAVGGGTAVVKFSGTVSGGGAAAAGVAGASGQVATTAGLVYAGEENTTQAGINIAGITNAGGASGASEAFDEPLTRAEVVAIVQPFFRPTIS